MILAFKKHESVNPDLSFLNHILNIQSDGVCVIPYFPLTLDQNACTSLLNRLPVFKVEI